MSRDDEEQMKSSVCLLRNLKFVSPPMPTPWHKAKTAVGKLGGGGQKDPEMQREASFCCRGK